MRQSGRRDVLADAMLDDRDKPRDHWQRVTANLTPAFRGVTGGEMGRLLSTVPPDLSWKKIVEGSGGRGMVVYFSMSSMMFSEVANRIGRVILQDLIGFLGRRYAFDDPDTDDADHDPDRRVLQCRLRGIRGRAEQGRRRPKAQFHAGHAEPGGPGGGDGERRARSGCWTT